MVTVDGGADGTSDPDAGLPMPGTGVPRPRADAAAGSSGAGAGAAGGRRARGRRVAGSMLSRPSPAMGIPRITERRPDLLDDLPSLDLPELSGSPPAAEIAPGPSPELTPGRSPEPILERAPVLPPAPAPRSAAQPATRPPARPRRRMPDLPDLRVIERPATRRQARAEEPRPATLPAGLRRIQLDDAAWWCVLAGFASGFAMIAAFFPGLLPLAAAFLLLMVGFVLTPPLYLLMDAAIVGGVVSVAILLAGRDVEVLPTVELVMIGAIVIGCARHRDRSGVSRKIGGVGEADTVLIDLRDRLRIRTAMPVLPPSWRLEAELRQAGGDRFGGDFVVAATPEPGRLDVVLVDVSGKGRTAGGRALLLQGAFAALLDSVPRDRFLVAANQHVLRHGDDESFATAVHLSLDLRSGHFVVAAAGHPPAAQHHAGSGRWSLKQPEQGPPLGVLPDVEYPVVRGRLESGDSLLLYTDGMVEGEGIDVVRGIDRLLGYAEPVLVGGAGRPGSPRGAARIMESIDSTGDDRGLVVLRHL